MRIFIVLLLVISPLFGTTICLNMIVKNETPVIERCLQSVLPYIDYWVIVDTGSTDGTQALIKDYLKEIPGELHERKWIDFSHNRNEALQLAKGKGDYILFIDADEELLASDDFELPHLDKDFYYIQTRLGGTKYKRVQLVKDKLDWKWEGVIHEAIVSSQAKSSECINGLENMARPDGNRSMDPLKYKKDIDVLEKAVIKEPKNTRYMFYLAQSYRDCGENQKALDTYLKRIQMGGWNEEIFWSMLQSAILKETLDFSESEIVEGYTEAFKYRPNRAEPLYRLALYYRKLKKFPEAYQVAIKGLAIQEPDDLLFVEKWIYQYGLILEYSVACYWTERFVEAKIATQLLLSNQNLPTNFRECAEKNMGWIEKKLNEIQLVRNE